MYILESLHNIPQADRGDLLRAQNGSYKSADISLSLRSVSIQMKDPWRIGPLGTSTTNDIYGTWNLALCDSTVLPVIGIEICKTFGLESLTHWTLSRFSL